MLPTCKLDCEYLVHQQGEWLWSKHAVVICNNPTNWPEQWVITDAMEKGKVPLSVFVKIMYGHKAWLGEHNIDGAELALIVVTSFAHSMRDTSEAFGPTLRSHARIEEITADIDSIADGRSEGHTDSDEHSKAADEATDVKDIDIDEEVAAHDDEAAPIDEHDFADGLRRDVEVTELRDGLPEYKVRESDVNKFMLFLPEH